MSKLIRLIERLDELAVVEGLSYEMSASLLKTTFLGNLENVYANEDTFGKQLDDGNVVTLLLIVVGDAFVEVQLQGYGEGHLVFRVVSGDHIDGDGTADIVNIESEDEFDEFVRIFDYHVRNVEKLA